MTNRTGPRSGLPVSRYDAPGLSEQLDWAPIAGDREEHHTPQERCNRSPGPRRANSVG